MKVFIDLFSGLGGASAAFDEHPDWTVLKFDNNEELLELNRGLHIVDILETEDLIRIIESYFPARSHLTLEKLVIWASPPCTEFSYARHRHRQEQTEFDMRCVEATLDIINHFAPDYWIMENVLGAVPVFEEEFGILPRQKIGSIIMWGHFPLIPLRARDSWLHRKLDAKGSRRLRANYRALIPRPVSNGLLDAVENQTNLNYWFTLPTGEES